MRVLRKLKDMKPGDTTAREFLDIHPEDMVRMMDHFLGELDAIIPDDAWGVEMEFAIAIDRVIPRPDNNAAE